MAVKENMAWPPADMSEVYADLDIWAAWSSSSPEELARVYGGGGSSTRLGRSFYEQPNYRHGIFGRIRRLFWGEPVPAGEKNTKLHAPLAKSIASTSANLLFSQAPQIKASDPDDTKVQGLLDDMVDSGVHATLLEAAETASALGGVYLKVVVDQEVSDKPWIEVVSPQNAIPEFRGGRLAAVSFWEVVSHDKDKVIRHIERHEKGWIFHELYEGTSDNLGRSISLDEVEGFQDLGETFDLREDGRNGIATDYKGLLAVYVPNIKPNQLWKSNRVGKNLGRSDYAGVEGLMDQLDEAWSDWMRDLRLGKARLIVDRSALETKGKGNGAEFEYDRELYVPMDLTLDEKSPIEQVQFEIRTDAHAALVQSLKEEIVEAAGYSRQTFGLSPDVAVTATEVNARERMTVHTRNMKINYWKPALTDLFSACLFMGSGIDATPEVIFAEVATEGMEERAMNVSLLAAAGAASTYQKVKMAHPEWDEPEIEEEVARIKTEQLQASQAKANGLQPTE